MTTKTSFSGIGVAINKVFSSQESVQGVLRIFRSLQEATVPDALFEAYVDLLKAPNFTQDFLNMFADDKRYKSEPIHWSVVYFDPEYYCRMDIVKRKMWKVAAEQADERLISLLLAYDKEVTPDKLLGYFGLVSLPISLCTLLG